MDVVCPELRLVQTIHVATRDIIVVALARQTAIATTVCSATARRSVLLVAAPPEILRVGPDNAATRLRTSVLLVARAPSTQIAMMGCSATGRRLASLVAVLRDCSRVARGKDHATNNAICAMALRRPFIQARQGWARSADRRSRTSTSSVVQPIIASAS